MPGQSDAEEGRRGTGSSRQRPPATSRATAAPGAASPPAPARTGHTSDEPASTSSSAKSAHGTTERAMRRVGAGRAPATASPSGEATPAAAIMPAAADGDHSRRRGGVVDEGEFKLAQRSSPSRPVPNPSKNPSRSSHPMFLGRPNRGNAAAGGGGGHDRHAVPLGNLCPRSFALRDRQGQSSGGGAALPGALGLGSFPRHELPAPPYGLDLNAFVAPPVSQVAPAPASPSHVCVQDLQDRVRTVESAFSEKDRILRDIQGEIQQMREEEHEKDRQIRSLVKDVEKEWQLRHTTIKRLDHDKELLRGTLQGYRKKLKKCSDAFLEYKKMCEGSGMSSSGVMADEQSRIRMMQQQLYADHINKFQKDLLSMFAGCADEIAMLATRITDLNNELQWLNDYIQIPDLNNGGPQL